MRNSILILVFMLVVVAKTLATGTDTFSVYFSTGVSKLNSNQQATLDSFIYQNSFRPNSILRIIGYADEPGTVELNQNIAKKRAEAVAKYFLDFGLKKQSIVQCIGRGNLYKTGDDPRQRRVDIVLSSVTSAIRMDSVERKPAKIDSGLSRLSSMKHGEVLVLEGLQFAVSTSAFLPESYPILKELVEVLQAHPNIKINIEGHICCGTDPKYPLTKQDFYSLSVDRAEHVCDYLVAHNISPERLSFEGFGFSKPRAYPERNEQDRFRNRRVELRIVSK